MLKKNSFAARIAIGAAVLLLPVVAHAGAPSAYDDLSVGTGQEDVTVTGQDSGDVRMKAVSLNDLNLRVDRDVRVADNRLRSAAADVCGVGRENGSVIARHESNCYADAFAQARVDLNSRISDVRAG